MARLARISAELVAIDAFRERLERLGRGLEHCADMGDRYEAMTEVAQAAAKQACLVLFLPTLSEPALLAEAAMRVYVPAKAGRTQVGRHQSPTQCPASGGCGEGARARHLSS